MINIQKIDEHSVEVLAAMSASELNTVQQSLEEASKQLKRAKERFSTALTIKFGEQIAVHRQQLNKPTGVVRLSLGGLTLFADIAKRPKWDQEKLADIAQRVRVNGEDPMEFMEVTYKVPEAKYQAWPQHLRDIFSSARTLNHGKQIFLLVDDKEDAA